MTKNNPGVLAALLAASCASAAVSEAPPVRIDERDLHRYWRPASGYQPVQQARVKGLCERSKVQVSYLIDDTGLTSGVKVLDSTPMNPFYEQHVRSLVTAARFTPAPDNDERQAVQLTETYEFECP